jgi:hypothetical protein
VKLRKAVESASPKPREDRLIVVFATTTSVAVGGVTALFPDWLPWIVVRPGGRSLIHEIGHACRLAHTRTMPQNVMYQGITRARYKGVISDEQRARIAAAEGRGDNFCRFQVEEIYKSYWCTGGRPQGWWWTQKSYEKINSLYMWGD